MYKIFYEYRILYIFNKFKVSIIKKEANDTCTIITVQ